MQLAFAAEISLSGHSSSVVSGGDSSPRAGTTANREYGRSGFYDSTDVDGVTVAVGKHTRVDQTLSAGLATDTVTVTGAPDAT